MITYVFLTLICVSATFAVPGNVTIKDCPPDWPGLSDGNEINITRLTVEGCIAEPCILTKLEPFEVGVRGVIGFSADSTNKIEMKMFAIPKGIPPVQFIKIDMCKFLNTIEQGICDKMEVGKIVEYKHTDQLPEIVPSFEGNILFMILRDDVCKYCGQVSIVIKDKEFSIKTTQDRLVGQGGLGGLGGGFLAG